MPSSYTSRHSRTLSPPLSASSQAFTIGAQPKPNIVTRLAIEGKARHGQDGASIKMYLKISLSLENVSPGTTLPLFPEENIKILKSQVHPIDNNSVPYNFSSTTCPLLHNAARALSLPARSSLSYLSNFGLSSTSVSSAGSSIRQPASNGANPPPLDDKYTGHILVSGYNVSYVLPKEFPRPKGQSLTENDEEGSIHNSQITPHKNRRSSLGDRNVIQFMAAIDMWVPYISKPPRAPYLLSIPIPRCLSNTVKLRIFSPTATSASLASLSSAEDDAGVWDLTSDPHVTRSASTRVSRTNSYCQLADDESSDSSVTGFSNGCGIQGTFPSAERVRVRWATPLKTINIPDGGDNRRRVGVREAKGEITCAVLGKGKDKTTGAEGVVMNIQYKGTCKGVWFPGVATLLGMDIGLESKGSDVTWANESEKGWSVDGGVGYTGHDMIMPPDPGQPPTDPPPQLFVLPASPGPSDRSRYSSTSSSSSLLRAPLPADNVPDYSFEGSATSTPSGTVSSLGSLPPSSTPNLDGTASPNGVDSTVRPPGVPITIHMNMNDLLPPSKNIFTFTISGTILLTPRSRSYVQNSQNSSTNPWDGELDSEPMVLPRLSVLAADTETTTIIIRNEAENANVEVYNPSGDIHDAQTRKTVLQKGGFTRCGTEGGRIALRSFRPMPSFRHRADDGVEIGRQPPSRPRTPSGGPSPGALLRQMNTPSLRSRRDGPLMIPSVVATVTLLLDDNDGLPDGYAVRMDLPAPCDGESEWLEFGFARPSSTTSAGPPQLKIASAAIDGVPVRFEMADTVKQEQISSPGLVVPFEMDGKEWAGGVRVYVAGRGGGNVLVDYVVADRGDADDAHKRGRYWKSMVKDEIHLDVLLPTFSLPVGRLEIDVETESDLEVSPLLSNLPHKRYSSHGWRLLHYSMDELFYPRLSLAIHSSSQRYLICRTPKMFSKLLKPVTRTAPTLLTLGLLFGLITLGSEIRQMKRSLDACSPVMASGWEEPPEPVTVTTTSSHGKWWFGELTPSSVTPATPSGSATLWSPQTTEAYPSSAGQSTPSPTTVSEELSSNSRLENSDLIPFINRALPWLADLELPPPTRLAMEKIIEGLGVVWRVFRRAYHYPLEPPS